MTRDEARDYFHEKGLTYADISRTDLAYLCSLLELHIVKQRVERKRSGGSSYWVRAAPLRGCRCEWTETGAMVCAFLTGQSAGFASRELVSFKHDGVIVLSGGTTDANAAPVLAAFVEWCDAMAEYKAFKKEDDHET